MNKLFGASKKKEEAKKEPEAPKMTMDECSGKVSFIFIIHYKNNFDVIINIFLSIIAW